MKKTYNKFYFVGAGGYGKQLSVMLKVNKLIKSVQIFDQKIKFNLKKLFNLKEKIDFNIFVGKPEERQKLFNILNKKKILIIQL